MSNIPRLRAVVEGLDTALNPDIFKVRGGLLYGQYTTAKGCCGGPGYSP